MKARSNQQKVAERGIQQHVLSQIIEPEGNPAAKNRITCHFLP
jgi:hypothetical protein